MAQLDSKAALNAAVNEVVALIHRVLNYIIDLGVAIIFASVVLKMFGLLPLRLPTPSETQLAWLMFAYAAFKFKGKLI